MHGERTGREGISGNAQPQRRLFTTQAEVELLLLLGISTKLNISKHFHLIKGLVHVYARHDRIT